MGRCSGSERHARRLLVAAALVVGVIAALSAPVGAQEPPIDDPDPNAFIPGVSTVINPRLEPNAQCGLDIAIVLDLSNSIDDTELAQLRTAAQNFVTALQGTPSNVGIYNFATFAPANGSAANTPLVFQSVATAAGATTARNKITGLTRPTSATGGTNWDRGIAQVTASGQAYDALLFLTDGDPTAFGIPGNPGVPPGNDDFGTGVDQVDVDAAVASANAVKAAGSRMIAVGIGTGASPGSVQRLQAISGPTENSDYWLTNFGSLDAALRAIASGTCDGHVLVNKVVRNVDGSTAPGAGWTFASSGTGVTPTSATTQAAGSVTFDVDFTAPTDAARPVTITETLLPGFEIGLGPGGVRATCTFEDGTPVPVTNVGPGTGFQVSVAPIDDITCTVTNNQLAPPRLTLVKTVTNDNGGTAVPTAWTLSATGPTPISGATGATAVTNAMVQPGTYALTETEGPAGYQAGAWSCTDGVLTGSSLVLDFGDVATCTINNIDIAAQLTLVKDLVQDPTSPTLPTAWTLSATGPTPISGTTGAAAVTDAPVNAGSYALAETGGPAGYALTGWSCTGATLTGTTVSIPLAADVTCTATNAATPSWTLAKLSDPASGTTVLPGDPITYTLTVTNTSDATISGITVTDDLADVLDDAAISTITPPAGSTATVGADDILTWAGITLPARGTASLTYVVTVDAVAFGASLRNVATGTGRTPPSTCPTGSVDCTTEHDTPLAPTLTLVKIVTNDDGGTATTTDFPLTATDGTTTITGTSGSAAVTNASVGVGTYTLSEVPLAGYAATGWNCTGTGTQDGDQITLGFGQTATCTITNNDVAPTLTLLKALDPPTAPDDPTDWQLTATGPTTITGAMGDTAVTSATVDAGTYTLSEDDGPGGYALAGWTCTPVASTGAGGATVVLPLDTDVTCTATNTFQPVDLQIEKLHRVTGTTDDRNVVAGTGETFDYDIIVRNVGTGSATGLVVTDAIPATLAVEGPSTTPTGWTAAVTGQGAGGFGGTFTAEFPGPFAPGDEVTFSFTVRVGPLSQPDPTQPPAPIENTATVDGDQDDGNPDDNTSTEVTPVKAVTLTALGVCRNNLPFLDYDIDALGFTPTAATLNWFSPAVWNGGNPTGPPSAASTIPLDQLTGSLLWPGAAVDAAGNPTDWPGWTLQPDGTWVEDPNAPGGDLRPATIVQVVVNPSVAATEAYPPTTPVCDPNPPAPGPPAPPTPPADPGSGGSRTGGRGRLPVTGTDLSWLVLAGAGLLVAGQGLVGLRPHRPRHLRR